jgi:pyruvate formate lyase activating enzyme
MGRIHSIESFGAVDGPGVRFVAFLQGCPLKCLFCHNPDSWETNGGREISAKELVDQILEYRNFIKDGGVTLSGGEPLMQPEFVKEVLTLCKQNGLHTAIDTSGGVELILSRQAIDAADMLLLDIKDVDSDDCEVLTGRPNKMAFDTLDYCEKTKKPVWIRHVLVPGYTLKQEKLERLAKFLSGYQCIEKVELLPFHKMGEFKWKEMNKKYELSDTPIPTEEQVKMAREIFIKQGLKL